MSCFPFEPFLLHPFCVPCFLRRKLRDRVNQLGSYLLSISRDPSCPPSRPLQAMYLPSLREVSGRSLNHPSGFGDQKKASFLNQQKSNLARFLWKQQIKDRQPGFLGGKRLHHGIGSTCKGVLRAMPCAPRSLRCARGLAAGRLPGATGGDAARLRAAAAHQHRGEAPRTWLLLALAGRSGSALAVGSRPVSGCRRILFAWGFHPFYQGGVGFLGYPVSAGWLWG